MDLELIIVDDGGLAQMCQLSSLVEMVKGFSYSKELAS